MFAKKFIPKGTLIGFYKGKVMTQRKWKRFLEKSHLSAVRRDVYGRASYVVHYKVKNGNRIEHYIVDGFDETTSSVFRYMNTCMVGERHIGENCFFHLWTFEKRFRVAILSLKDIHPGEELFVDYGERFFFTRYDAQIRFSEFLLEGKKENAQRETESFHECVQYDKVKNKWSDAEVSKARKWYEEDKATNPWIQVG